MKGRLSAIQLEYVLDHLGHHAELNDELRKMIHYGGKEVPGVPSIRFPASEAELDNERKGCQHGLDPPVPEIEIGQANPKHKMPKDGRDHPIKVPHNFEAFF